MNKTTLILLAAATSLMTVSCGEGIKDRPISNRAKTNKTENGVSSRSGVAVYKPEAFKKYDVCFWDNMDEATYPEKKHEQRMMTSAIHEIHNDIKSGDKNQMAFQLGLLFASADAEKVNKRLDIVKSVVPQVAQKDSSSTNSSEKYFIKCMQAADKEAQYGKAALMMSGYYIGYLQRVVSNTNTSTLLPDEATLAKGIVKLDSLKSYCNNVLIGEPDMTVAREIQKVTVQADTIKSIYSKCQNSAGANKYAPLENKLKNIEEEIF